MTMLRSVLTFSALVIGAYLFGIGYSVGVRNCPTVAIPRYYDVPIADPHMELVVDGGVARIELRDKAGKVYQKIGAYVKGKPCEIGEDHIAYCQWSYPDIVRGIAKTYDDK